MTDDRSQTAARRSEALSPRDSLKHLDADLDALLALDARARNLRAEVERLEAERNHNAKRVAAATPELRAELIARGRTLAEQIARLRPALEETDAEVQRHLASMPIPPAPDVPIGAGEADNVELRRWGEPRTFDFEARDHVALLELNGWAQLGPAAEVAGARSHALQGSLVFLELALMQFALERLQRAGFVPLTVPAMARARAFFGTGHFPANETETYALGAGLFLVGTGEVSVNALHAKEVLSVADLPIRYAALSSCFRREAGSAGRDTRGLMRVHQFIKVEQYVLCENDAAESQRWFETILANAEEILRALELPYRVVLNCTGDMGAGKVRQCDLETWVPGGRATLAP